MAALYSEGAPLAGLPSAIGYRQAASGLHHLSEAVDSVPELAAYIPRKSPVISIPDSTKHAICNALEVAGGERGKAARMLGIGRTTLYRKMKAYRID
jgi:transcriptional regulator of acetoin/glycerol metabolism